MSQLQAEGTCPDSREALTLAPEWILYETDAPGYVTRRTPTSNCPNKQSGRQPLPRLSPTQKHRNIETIRLLLSEPGVASFDSTPMEFAQEVVYVLRPAWAVFMVVGVLENVTGDQWNSAPNRSILMFVHENIEQALRIKGI